jgi:hypothetical protein
VVEDIQGTDWQARDETLLRALAAQGLIELGYRWIAVRDQAALSGD